MNDKHIAIHWKPSNFQFLLNEKENDTNSMVELELLALN